MSCAELMIFSILVAVVAISNGENTTECRRYDGMYYNGNNIDWKRVEGEEDCANWCRRISECRYWSLFKSANYCYLKTSDSGGRWKNDNAVSGTKGCATATECRREDGILYYGNTIDRKTVEGEEDCANWCGRISDCRVWSLHKTHNYCRLKTSDSARGGYSNWVSGTKGCATASACKNNTLAIKKCGCGLTNCGVGQICVDGTKCLYPACAHDAITTENCGCGSTNCGFGQMCVGGTKCEYPVPAAVVPVAVVPAAVIPVAVVPAAAVPADVVAAAIVPVAVVAPTVVPAAVVTAAVVAPAVVPAAVVPAEKGGKDDDSGEDEPFCVAVDCSLPNAENLCPIKCSLQKDPEFCCAVGCSHSNSQTFCPIKCSGVTNLDDVLVEIRGVKTQIEQLKTTLLYHVYGNH